MYKLTLVISSLTSGGAERVMSIMANYWAKKGWEITLLALPDESVPPFYKLEPCIKYIPLGVAGNSPNGLAAISNNLKRIRVLRSAIVESKPDVVISFLDITNVLTLLATRNLNVPILVDEQNNPAMYSIGRTWELLRRWTYPKADRVVAVTERALNYFSPQVQSHGCVIPSPALSLNVSENPSEKLLVKPALIAVGRLVPQKGFDLLLQAFAKLKDRYPEWTLTILGEGVLRPELESLRDQLGLSDRVYLPGVVKNPHDFLKQADIFVMSSRFEGFPNALCEAMVCGLPTISTDCPSGPREIIRDGIDGVLVPNQDVPALTAAMERLMSDEQDRKRLAARASEITERFSIEKVMKMWESLIEEVIKERRK
jgi:glycosyltransferase involved in cell wall biosynthesis